MISIHLDEQIHDRPDPDLDQWDLFPKSNRYNHHAEQCPIDSHLRLCVKLADLGNQEVGGPGHGNSLAKLIVFRWLLKHYCPTSPDQIGSCQPVAITLSRKANSCKY